MDGECMILSSRLPKKETRCQQEPPVMDLKPASPSGSPHSLVPQDAGR
jgi:hypothetical protein